MYTNNYPIYYVILLCGQYTFAEAVLPPDRAPLMDMSAYGSFSRSAATSVYTTNSRQHAQVGTYY